MWERLLPHSAFLFEKSCTANRSTKETGIILHLVLSYSSSRRTKAQQYHSLGNGYLFEGSQGNLPPRNLSSIVIANEQKWRAKADWGVFRYWWYVRREDDRSVQAEK